MLPDVRPKKVTHCVPRWQSEFGRTSRAIVLLASVLLAVATDHAAAATATTSFTVSATVVSVCTVAATALSFGSYNPVTGGNLDATSTVTATCTLGTPYTVGLDNGQHVSGGQRRMALLTSFLDYEMYSDSGRTQRWGSSGGELVSGTGNGSAQALTVYGRVTGGQAVTAGAYSDLITVTVTF
jgi:spore coat protein U-like protein